MQRDGSCESTLLLIWLRLTRGLLELASTLCPASREQRAAHKWVPSLRTSVTVLSQERARSPDSVQWLAKRPLADSLAELQEQLDRFDHLYSAERGHQELPDRIIPQQAWEATPVVSTPIVRSMLEQPPKHVAGEGVRTVSSDGSCSVLGCNFRRSQDYYGARLHVTWDLDEITAFDDQGTQLATFNRPPAGTRHVGDGRPRGLLANQQPSPMS